MHLSLCAPCGDCVNTGLAGCEAVRVRSALSMTMTGVQGTSNRLSYFVRLRPKNRLYEEHGSRGARSSCLDRTGRSGRVVYVHDRSPFSVGRAGSLSRCCSVSMSVSPRRLSVLSVPRTRDAGYNASRAPGLAPGVCNTLSPSAVCLCAEFVRASAYVIFLRFSVGTYVKGCVRMSTMYFDILGII